MNRCAAFFAFCLSLPAQAGELAPLQGQFVELGGFRGIVYVTDEEDGYRVVITISEDETGLPVRFIATLADHQSVALSVPGRLGEPSHALEISRVRGILRVDRTELVGPEPVAAAPKVLGQ